MAGLNRDLLKLNTILKMNRGQENSFAAATTHARIPASALPAWMKIGARCCYVSKSSGMHSVKVQKIDEKKQLVTVVFEADSNSGKQVPFHECSKTGDGTLRPVFKAGQSSAASTSAPLVAPSKPQATVPVARSEVEAKKPRSADPVEDLVSSGDEETKKKKPSKDTAGPKPTSAARGDSSNAKKPVTEPGKMLATETLYGLTALPVAAPAPPKAMEGPRPMFAPRSVTLGTGKKVGPATQPGGAEIIVDDAPAAKRNRTN